jgi:periplasmic divalent cation tolerance protein|tara:strand:- start:139 stop:456 length:318 start_codon:yes stop_codon:yes gene_type:complete
MTPLIIVQTTFPTSHDIAPICQALIDGKMAICIKEFPAVKSRYLWDNEIEESLEVIVHVKTYKHFFSAVEEMILRAHPYDIPEIITIQVDAVSKGYQQWADDTLG